MVVSNSWMFYGGSRLNGTLISPPHFEELGRFQAGVHLPPVNASVPALEYA